MRLQDERGSVVMNAVHELKAVLEPAQRLVWWVPPEVDDALVWMGAGGEAWGWWLG